MPQTTPTTSKFRVFVSLSFWLTILVSCSLLGSVYLAPKIVTHEKLSEDYYENQLRLVERQNRVEHFRNVATALRTDPHFRKEMQRVELGIAEAGTESIPVDGALTLDPSQTVERPSSQRVTPWYVSYLRPFAEDRSRRQWSLWTAGLSMLFAFVFLQESVGKKAKRNWKVSRLLARKLFSRYKRVGSRNEP